MLVFLIINSLLLIAVSAVVSRAIGSEGDYPRWLERLIGAALFFYPATFYGPYGLISFIGTLGIVTGHGQYFLDLQIKAIKAEKIDFIVSLFWGKDPRTQYGHLSGAAQTASVNKAVNEYGMRKLYWRCVTGWSVKGLLTALPAAGTLSFFAPNVGMIYLLYALFLPASYMVSYKFFNRSEPAEYMKGAARGFIASMILWILI